MRMLVCTDGSPLGQAALRFGVELARVSPEQATLLGVVERAADRGRLEDALQEGRRWLEGAPEPRVKVRIGHADEEILDEASAGVYDLLVVGTRGRRGITRFLLGSTAERILRHAQVPVLLVQGRREQLKQVLICTGGGKPGLAAVEVGGGVARLTAAEVTVLHVMSQLPASPVLPEAGALQVMPQTPPPPKPSQVHLEELEAGADELIAQGTREGVHLEKALSILSDMGVTARALVRHGLVVDEIEGEACAKDYDLVVVGSHTVEGWMRLLLNNVERQIIDCVGRPVLVVKTSS
jgi:nucleotide-binding universal stress UspA family protein